MILIKILNKIRAKNTIKLWKYLSTQTSSTNTSDSVQSFDDFKCLATNKRNECKIKIILNEYKQYRNSEEERDNIPSRLTIRQMRQLLDCHKAKQSRRIWIDLSPQQRKHLLLLFRRYEDFDGNNQLMEPIMPLDLEKLYINRMRNAFLFGQNVCFDFSFDEYMSTMECKNLAEQLIRIYKFNKYEYMEKYEYSSEEPFNLNICNVDKSQKSYQFIEHLYPDIVSDKSFVNVTSESYLDLFPKRDIIYLSPHAEEVMTEYDKSAVFIIGGIVDRQKIITLSYPKAVQQNIRSMRLPIDLLINKCNIQSLDSVFRVLFDFKAFGVNNEKISLEERIRRHIPKHKLKPLTQTTVKSLQREEFTQIYDNSNELNEELNKNIDMKCN